MTTICHSNFFAHRMLTDQGACVHEHYSETYEDIGDAENGPQLSGGPAFDKYFGDSHEFIIDHTGRIVASFGIDWDEFRFFAEISDEMKNGAGQLDDVEYKRPRKTGEDWQVIYTDEDGPWYACHGYGWDAEWLRAGFFSKIEAEQIAHRFNIAPQSDPDWMHSPATIIERKPTL